MRDYKQRMGQVLQIMEKNVMASTILWIVSKYSNTPWKIVWRNFHTAGLSDTLRSTLYKVIHDIVPTYERLAAINIVSAVKCVLCNETDTVLHRIVKCTEGAITWNWTRTRIAAILRAHQSVIPEEWTIRPMYKLWPAKRQTAITWIIAHLIFYLMQTRRRQSLMDYIDYMRRARWKCYNQTQKACKVGKYLDVL
jgi:hypothetical protein